jgi:hypothetical protein
VRDYFKKGSFFNKILLKALPQHSQTIKKIQEKYMDQLELPGDVWNNNSVFKKNLIEPILKDNTNRKPALIIRDSYEKNKKLLDFNFYPEQFDLTFDFVPRMCENPNNKIIKGFMCKICPFGPGNILKYCHKQSELNCGIMMYLCGYTVTCNPNDCPIKDNLCKNLCKTLIEV